MHQNSTFLNFRGEYMDRKLISFWGTLLAVSQKEEQKQPNPYLLLFVQLSCYMRSQNYNGLPLKLLILISSDELPF